MLIKLALVFPLLEEGGKQIYVYIIGNYIKIKYDIQYRLWFKKACDGRNMHLHNPTKLAKKPHLFIKASTLHLSTSHFNSWNYYILLITYPFSLI